jgi:hypothetical protein
VKIYRKFKQDKREFQADTTDNDLKAKIEKYKKVEEFIENYDNKLIEKEYRDDKPQESNRVRTSNNINKDMKNKEDNLLQKKTKRSKEEYEKEISEKREKRKKTYKNLNKKTPKGQPLMKYQVGHLLSKIKDKIAKGMI